MWRNEASLFIPELPGYGISSPPSSPNKRTVGSILLEALQQSFIDGTNRPIIWCGHDRGARVGHRVLASHAPGSDKIISAVFMDIVPTREQWRSFSNPAAGVAYFHWPFLAMSATPDLLLALGGDKFVRIIFEKSVGKSKTGEARLKENDAVELYCHLFSKEDTIKGSCADYADGSVPECREQEEDQANGRKIKVPTLVLYSADYLGKMHDIESCWKPYMDAELQCFAVPDGIGHYLPESAPDVVGPKVLGWLDKLT